MVQTSSSRSQVSQLLIISSNFSTQRCTFFTPLGDLLEDFTMAITPGLCISFAFFLLRLRGTSSHMQTLFSALPSSGSSEIFVATRLYNCLINSPCHELTYLLVNTAVGLRNSTRTRCVRNRPKTVELNSTFLPMACALTTATSRAVTERIWPAMTRCGSSPGRT